MKPRPRSPAEKRATDSAQKAGPARRGRGDSAFLLARERYAQMGVDVDEALAALAQYPISLQCWQGDDVTGFEFHRHALGGGLAVTGNYPGRARSALELRADLDQVWKWIPGRHRLNLHAIYGDFDGRAVDRDEITTAHFLPWLAWAKERNLGLDFNPTCFAHPKAADGLTLSHPREEIRQFWIEHCRRARAIGADFGRTLGHPCITNVWIPDGSKDTPADRWAPRERLSASLDAVFTDPLPARWNIDAVEAKLFGLGAESYTVGSHEFYLGYALSRKKFLCLDAGHFHPTESLADKLSAVLPYVPGILLHVSRGVRWDSDHVVTLNDELIALAREVVRSQQPGRLRLGLDYFDASINRLAAWAIGARATLQALLQALLEPPGIREAEIAGDFTSRLVLQETAKALPFGAVWDQYCEIHQVPTGERWLTEARQYERNVLAKRG